MFRSARRKILSVSIGGSELSCSASMVQVQDMISGVQFDEVHAGANGNSQFQFMEIKFSKTMNN